MENGWEFVLGADGRDAQNVAENFSTNVIPVTTGGYIETVLEDVMSRCSGDYILRLDDDEALSEALLEWILKENLTEKTYTFFRANLWRDTKHFIKKIWPDSQTRLTRKDCSTWSKEIHSISPHGFGVEVPKAILHYKFLVKSYPERIEIARKYESIRDGAGFGEYKKFSLPEEIDNSNDVYSLDDLSTCFYVEN